MKSKYACFDRSQLIVKPLAERANDLEIGRWLALDPPNAETLSSEWVDDQVAAPVSVTRQALHAVRTMCSLLTLPARTGR